MHDDDPARLEVLSELRRLAVEVFGEERAAEALLQANLASAASAVWRVLKEPIGPGGDEP